MWIHPSPRAASIAVGLALLAALAAWALARLARRLIRAVRRRLLSPRDRALLELSDLVARGLIGRGEFKAFFLELTGIVRRYIERAHRIRAPEQTTEEFLNAAARDPRFRPDVLATLRRFLETADLVKFAAYRPDPGAADRAHATAVEYIRTDERLSAPADRELA